MNVAEIKQLEYERQGVNLEKNMKKLGEGIAINLNLQHKMT